VIISSNLLAYLNAEFQQSSAELEQLCSVFMAGDVL